MLAQWRVSGQGKLPDKFRKAFSGDFTDLLSRPRR